MGVRDVDDLLDAVYVAGERRHDHPLAGLADDLVEHATDLPFGGDEAGDLGIGGIDEEQVDALVAEPTEPGEIGEPAVERELVQFDVAGVQCQTRTGADGDGDGIPCNALCRQR